MATRYFAAPQGNVFIAARDASGQTGGFVPVGDTDGFNITTSQQFLDIYESQSGNRGIVAHVPTQSDYAVDLSVLNIDGDNLARAFYGSTGAVVGAAVVGEAITAYNGQAFALKYPGTSAVTITKTAGSVPLVLDTDYTIDHTTGLVTIKSTSTVVAAGAGVPCTVNYTHAGVASRVKGAVSGLKDYTIRVEVKSKFDDKVQIFTIHRCALDMASTLSLIGTGVNKLPLKGKLLPAAEQAAGESQYFTMVQV